MIAAASAAVIAASAWCAPTEGEALHPREVAPGVHVLAFSDRYGSANAGWIAGEESAVLVGAPHPDVVPRLLDEAARSTGKPVRIAILTHARKGEEDAARALAGKGVEVVASPEAAARIRAAGWPDGGRLREVNARASLPGSTGVDFIPLGHAAGPGNAAVLAGGVLFAGETCVNGPRAALRGSSTERWIEALRTLRSLRPAPAVVVPGFGTVGGAEILERQERFLAEMRRQVAHGVARLWPIADVRRSVRIEPEWLVWMPYDTPTAEDIDHVYGELTAPPFALPFDDGGGPPVLAVIGDSPHEPGHLEEGLRPAFREAGVQVRFAVDPRLLDAKSLERVKLLVILRDGASWPDGPEKPSRGWMSPEVEAAIAAFVERGGAFLALHNATGLYPEGGPYLKLLGGTYNGHGPLERFRVTVKDPEHPITRGVEAYEVADEQHTPIPDLATVRIILESRSAEGVKAPAGWVRDFGKGRVAYLANGHTRDALNHPMYRRLLVNAVWWCLRLE